LPFIAHTTTRVPPWLQQFAGQFANLACYKVDIDESGDIAEECDVSKLPTFQVWKGGVKVGAGSVQARFLLATFAAVMAAVSPQPQPS